MSTIVCWFQRTLKQLEREQTDTQTHKATTVTLAHARRGLISEVLNRVKVDIVAGQETWERKDKVDGYKWFGKPRTDQNSRRGEGGVGFLVRECIAEEVEFIRDVM